MIIPKTSYASLIIPGLISHSRKLDLKEWKIRLSREPPHIPFIYYGANMIKIDEFKKEVYSEIINLTPEEKEVYIKELEVHNTEKNELLVIKIEVSESIKLIHTKLCKKYKIKPCKFRPYFILGKVIEGLELPKIKEKRFKIENISFHK